MIVKNAELTQDQQLALVQIISNEILSTYTICDYIIGSSVGRMYSGDTYSMVLEDNLAMAFMDCGFPTDNFTRINVIITLSNNPDSTAPEYEDKHYNEVVKSNGRQALLIELTKREHGGIFVRVKAHSLVYLIKSDPELEVFDFMRARRAEFGDYGILRAIPLGINAYLGLGTVIKIEEEDTKEIS